MKTMWFEWHFRRCTSGLGSSFTVIEHQATTRFLWSSLGWGHRRTQRGKIPFELAVCRLFLVVMTLPTFLNGAHIFKSCYGCSMGLFSPTWLHWRPSQPICLTLLNSAHFFFFVLWRWVASSVDVPLQLFFWGFWWFREGVSLLSRSQCWENYHWISWVRGSSEIRHADNETSAPPRLTSVFLDGSSLKKAAVW